MRNFIDVSQLKIEKNVPIPKAEERKLRISQLFKKMKVGESVLIKNISANRAYTIGWTYLGKGNSMVRKNGSGYRIWRVK